MIRSNEILMAFNVLLVIKAFRLRRPSHRTPNPIVFGWQLELASRAADTTKSERPKKNQRHPTEPYQLHTCHSALLDTLALIVSACVLETGTRFLDRLKCWRNVGCVRCE